MKEKRSRALRGVVGGFAGLLLGVFFVAPTGYYPRLMDVLMVPAVWLFTVWHDLGLPPQGDAALIGPPLVFASLCSLIGVAIGALSCRRRAERSGI